jgi:hypothetical protein
LLNNCTGESHSAPSSYASEEVKVRSRSWQTRCLEKE